MDGEPSGRGVRSPWLLLALARKSGGRWVAATENFNKRTLRRDRGRVGVGKGTLEAGCPLCRRNQRFLPKVSPPSPAFHGGAPGLSRRGRPLISAPALWHGRPEKTNVVDVFSQRAKMTHTSVVKQKISKNEGAQPFLSDFQGANLQRWTRFK